MAKKFYAVKNGRTTGIFKTWDECKRQVMGFKDAAYKGFETLEEAEGYLGAAEPDTSPRGDAVTAYVDGSYNIYTKVFAYGAVIFDRGEELTLSESFSDTDMAAMRNVAGEIRGAMAAMDWCLERGRDKLDIYYDYAGIEKWCTGEWKTNKRGTIEYKAYYDSIKDRLDVRFMKVKGHSGNKYNDMADRLAKDAAGVE